MAESENDDVTWDQDFADGLIGATLFVGITHLDPDGTLVRREQVFGRVEAVDAETGITIQPSGGAATFILAPILEAIEPAPPGHYQISGEHEAIENPDYTIVFSLTAPRRH